MLSALKNLKLWQALVLTVLTFGVAGGIYGVYSWATGPSVSSLAANTQLVAVQYGNLVTTVSASGSLVLPNTEQLTFGSAGTVQEMNVKAGDTVAQGQVLAKLDSTSILSLEVAVSQAEIALRDAEDKLENPYTELEIARAELAVVNAKIALKTAQENLNGLGSCPLGDESCSLEFQQKQIELVVASAALAEAEATLANIQEGGDPLEVKSRELEVSNAQAALEEAQKKLEMATMVAPFNGVVASVNIAAGDTVNASTIAIEVMDPSVVEVSATLGEYDDTNWLVQAQSAESLVMRRERDIPTPSAIIWEMCRGLSHRGLKWETPIKE